MGTAIKSSYLMWIGKESYPTIADWASEAASMGISKRLPSVALAQKLMEPGSVVFVAHDEGEFSDCETCMGEIECPECRKVSELVSKLKSEVAKIKRPFTGDADFETFASASQKRSVRIRTEKAAELAESECELCFGERPFMGGTGGSVVLKDGTGMDYRAFNYHLHQPKKFDASTVVTREMCRACGGTGKLPEAKIFGMFVPSAIEYIVAGDEAEEKLKSVADFTHIDAAAVALEGKRLCGVRRKGGVYAVASTKASSKSAKKALAELIESGAVKAEGADVQGNFVHFTSPIPVAVKRFRGVKTYSLGVEVEEAATDVLDAMEG